MELAVLGNRLADLRADELAAAVGLRRPAQPGLGQPQRASGTPGWAGGPAQAPVSGRRTLSPSPRASRPMDPAHGG